MLCFSFAEEPDFVDCGCIEFVAQKAPPILHDHVVLLQILHSRLALF